MNERDSRQIIQDMFSALDINKFNRFNHIKGEVKKSSNNAIFLNGRECTTAVRANEDEGWVELLIVSSIEDGLPSFAHDGGVPHKVVLEGEVDVLSIREEV